MRHGCAVVLGGSATGLMAAAAAARRFERVVLIERDALVGDEESARKGVPQGRHNHNLTPRATAVLAGLFPGILEELRARGAFVGDAGAEGRWVVGGVKLARARVGRPQILVSRPCLDAMLTRRIRALQNVVVRDRTDVCGLVLEGGRVRGVRLLGRADGAEQLLPADLVLDASGRGSRLPSWLADVGLAGPEEESLEVKVSYATRVFRRRATDLGGDRFLYVSSAAPSLARGGVAFAVEDDRWMVLLFGYGGERPPLELAEFTAYARSLAVPDLGELVANLEPLGDAAPFQFPRSVRRRYDRLALPDGVLALGDALSSTNPCWGLGITSAALQLETLEARLKEDAIRSAKLQVALMRAASTIWDDVSALDRALDVVPGEASLPRRVLRRYVAAVTRAASEDEDLAALLLSVIGYARSPEGLLRPDRVLRALCFRPRAELAPPAARALGLP